MARILAIPEAEVAALLARDAARLRRAPPRVRGAARAPLRAGRAPRRATSRCRASAGCSSAPTSPTSTRSKAPRCSIRRIVPAPDQTGVAAGEQRVRDEPARGRRGPHLVDRVSHRRRSTRRAQLTLRSARDRSWSPATARRPPSYDKRAVSAPSWSSSARATISPGRCSSRLPEAFTLAELEQSLAVLERDGPPHAISFETRQDHPRARLVELRHHASPPTRRCRERVIFPAGPHETHGMEDARFVRFTDDDGRVDLLRDLHRLRRLRDRAAADPDRRLRQLPRSRPSTAPAAQNKGMALFPRRIGGRYVMLSRRDRENLHLATSTDVGHWTDVTELHRPQPPLGAPADRQLRLADRDRGRLAGDHPRRRTDAALRHRRAAARSRGSAAGASASCASRCSRPRRASARATSRTSSTACGALVNGDDLVLPYGLSDAAVGIAIISLPELLAALSGPEPAQGGARPQRRSMESNSRPSSVSGRAGRSLITSAMHGPSRSTSTKCW